MATKKTNMTESEKVVLFQGYHNKEFLTWSGEDEDEDLSCYSINIGKVDTGGKDYLSAEFKITDGDNSFGMYLLATDDDELSDALQRSDKLAAAAEEFAARVKLAVEAARLANKLAKKE
jgi:hypothetical protein